MPAAALPFMVRTLLDAGLLHEDVHTVVGKGLRRYIRSRSSTVTSWSGAMGPLRAWTKPSCARQSGPSRRRAACVCWKATWDAA